MTLGLLYWILLLLWIVFGSWLGYAGGYRFFAPNILLLVLFIIIGWKIFGAPIHG